MKTAPLSLLLGALLLIWAPPSLPAQDEDEKKDADAEVEKAEKKKGFRIFTGQGKNAKRLELRVVSRIDDDRYTFETPEGKTFTLDVTEKLSKADQLYLETWEPNAILDIASADLSDVLAKKTYSGSKLSTVSNNLMVEVKLGDKDAKFILDAGRHFSMLSPAAAKDLGLTLRQGIVTYTDAGGKAAQSQQGTIKSLTIGEVELSSVSFEVLDISRLFSPLPANTSGSIGTNLLKKLNALVDFEGGQIYVRENDE